MINTQQLIILTPMMASFVVLALDIIGAKKDSLIKSEKPHIRIFSITSLSISACVILKTLLNTESNDQSLFVYLLSSLSIVLGAALVIGLCHRSFKKRLTGDDYFLILSSSTLALVNVFITNLLLNMACLIGFMITMTALIVRTSEGSKKVELGLKLVFSTICIFLLYALAVIILQVNDHKLDVSISFINNQSISITFYPSLLLSLVGVILCATPPFHFGYVDCAEGANTGVALLLLNNSFIQGCVLLYRLNISHPSFLIYVLSVGVMLTWIRAVDQSKIRRTVAYISISIGPTLALCLLFGESQILPIYMYYLLLFMFNLLSLFVLFSAVESIKPFSSHNNTWEDLSGYGKINGLNSLVLLVVLASIAGIPGTLGYFLKLSLLSSLNIFAVSIIIFLSTVIAITCIMRIFVFIFSKHQHIAKQKIDNRVPLSIIISSLLLTILGFFTFLY